MLNLSSLAYVLHLFSPSLFMHCVPAGVHCTELCVFVDEFLLEFLFPPTLLHLFDKLQQVCVRSAMSQCIILNTFHPFPQEVMTDLQGAEMANTFASHASADDQDSEVLGSPSVAHDQQPSSSMQGNSSHRSVKW